MQHILGNTESRSFIFWGQTSSRRDGWERRKMKVASIPESGKGKWMGSKWKPSQVLMLELGTAFPCASSSLSHLHFVFSSILVLSLIFFLNNPRMNERVKTLDLLFWKERTYLFPCLPFMIFFTWLCSEGPTSQGRKEIHQMYQRMGYPDLHW